MPVLATKETCTGCSACANICPHDAICVSPDLSGFLMPEVNEKKCIECKLCEKACPIVNGVNLKHPEVTDVYAFWDNKTRTESSSGGAFSALARWVLDRGGVVFGAAWHNGFKCAHISCECWDELPALRGSKYLQSDIKHTFVEARQALRNGRYVLFTGTPCQIAGLRSFLIKPYEKLVTVDIVCHGVPSNALFINYIDKLKSGYGKYASATGFEFRNRRGWGIAPSTTRENCRLGTLVGVPNLYMSAFEKAAIFRESCYDCHFNGLARVGDITIADYWGIGASGKPFRHDVTKGVSLILINSDSGKAIVDNLKDCFIEKRYLNEATKLNHNLVGSSKRPSYRNKLIESFNNPNLSLEDINNSYSIVGTEIKNRLRDTLVKTGLFWPIKSAINKIRNL